MERTTTARPLGLPSEPSTITLRVLCPDGATAEDFTDNDEERVLRWAHLAAANADDMHDGARCIGPHRIVRATWTEVER